MKMPPDIQPRSKKISRQLVRHMGHADAEDHIKALYDFIACLPSDKIQPPQWEFLATFGGFLDSVDKSYFEYEDKLKILSRSLEISSQELNVSSRRLENLNDTINTMLNSLGQGLVFFNSEGICSQVCSKACETLLDQAPSEKKIYEVLGLSDVQKDNFLSWLEIVYSSSSALSFEALAHLAPDEYINRQAQYVQLDYKPVYSYNNDLTDILLIATDKTMEKRAEMALQETQVLSRAIVSIAQNRNEFSDFMRNARSFVLDLMQREGHDTTEVLRELHTCKGLSLHFGLEDLAQAFHDAEDRIAGQELSLRDQYRQMLISINFALEQANMLAEDVLGKDYLDRGQVRSIQISQIRWLKDKVSLIDDPRIEEIKQLINKEMLGASLHECFSVFESEISRIAGIQGKSIPRVIYHSVVESIILSDYRSFFESLIHLARNIMDHGIEAPSVRRKSGKDEQGKVDIYVSIKQGPTPSLEITIGDDGQGLNAGHLRERLAFLNLHDGDVASLSDADVIQYIFHPGFSSRSSATALSGRGVGMYAIRKAVQDSGGTCRAGPGNPGSLFTFNLPILP